MAIQNQTTQVHYCDFCGDSVYPGDAHAMIYAAHDFQSTKISLGFRGAWLACTTCAAFIRQYDNGEDDKAKHNLAMRSMEKYRRKYNMRGVSDREINKVLMHEIRKLHDAFWTYRTDEPPTPYTITDRLLEAD